MAHVELERRFQKKKKKSNELGCYNEYRLRQAEDS
jgi:hypothetical protein